MIVPDTNLLLHAYDEASERYAVANAWWRDCLGGAEVVGLPLVVLTAYVQIGTSRRVYSVPKTPAQAAADVRSWLAQPVARLLEPATDHLDRVLALIESVGTAGNLVTDAQIAALAMAHNAVVHTSDNDFQRFPGVRWFNPFTGRGS